LEEAESALDRRRKELGMMDMLRNPNVVLPLGTRRLFLMTSQILDRARTHVTEGREVSYTGMSHAA
jgi:hypothetical protein